MARIIPVGFGELSFVMTSALGTDPFVHTLGVSLAGVDEADYVEAADFAFDCWLGEFQALTDSDLRFDRVELAVGLAGGTSGSVRSTSGGANGIRTTTSVPIVLAFIVNKITAQLGRKGRGRAFIPGVLPADNVSEGGRVGAAQVTAYGEAYNDMLVALATDTVGSTPMAPVLLHADGSTPTPITGAIGSSLVGTLRKRIR